MGTIPNQQQLADDLQREREIFVAYLQALPEAAWDKSSLCEGWTVRDVICHVIGNATDLAAQNLEGVGTVEYNQRQIDERAGKSLDELFAEWDVSGPAYEQNMRELPDDFWNAPYAPWGTVGQALERMLEDIWVHRQDVRVPLGDGLEDGAGIGAAIHVGAFEVPVRASEKNVALGTVTLSGGGHTETIAVGDGPNVGITGDGATLALVITGRISLDEATADGTLTIDGDAPAGFDKVLNIYAG